MRPRLLRPWALFTPLVVLIATLPFCGPRSSADAAPRERAALRAALVVGDETDGRDLSVLRDVPRAERPTATFVALLALPAWAARRAGETDFVRLGFFLTVALGALPTAAAAGLVYRMGRTFGLPRPQRTLLAFACAGATGWLACATRVAPAALGAAGATALAAAVLYVGSSDRPGRSAWLLAPAGFAATLAGSACPASLLVSAPIALTTLGLRVPRRRIALLLVAVGALPALWLHAAWNVGAFGSLLPPGADVDPVDALDPPSTFARLGSTVARAAIALFGPDGALLWLPALVVGPVGAWLVLHRHWPAHVKLLAAATLAGTLLVGLSLGLDPPTDADALPNVARVLPAAPLAVFWGGALLRHWSRTQPRAATAGRRYALQFAAAVAAAVSLVVTLLAAARWLG